MGIRASRSHTQSTPAVCGRGGVGGGDVAKCHAFIMIVAVAGCQAARHLPCVGVSTLPMMMSARASRIGVLFQSHNCPPWAEQSGVLDFLSCTGFLIFKYWVSMRISLRQKIVQVCERKLIEKGEDVGLSFY